MPRRMEARDATEVYTTTDGQVALKQEGGYGQEDSIVLIDVNDVPTIIKWLEEAAVDAAEIRETNLAAVQGEQVVPR